MQQGKGGGDIHAQRDAYFDNAKFYLILLVVLGHGLEIVGISLVPGLYKLLYLFHMPVFVVLTGYFSKRCSLASIAGLGVYYLAFQTAYLLFARLVLHKNLPMRYIKPYWILWFLLACLVWKLTTPLLARLPFAFVLPATLVLCLAVGYDPGVGREYSLSRILVFYPFFVLGYYAKREHFMALKILPRSFCWGVFAFSLVAVSRMHLLPPAFLFGADHYGKFGMQGAAPLLLRLVCLVWGFLLGCCFLALIPTGQKAYSPMGRRTLALYLLHGFALRYVAQATPLPRLMDTFAERIAFFVPLACLAFLLLTNPVHRALGALVLPLKALGRRKREAAG